jgi:hypothetical protein
MWGGDLSGRAALCCVAAAGFGFPWASSLFREEWRRSASGGAVRCAAGFWFAAPGPLLCSGPAARPRPGWVFGGRVAASAGGRCGSPLCAAPVGRSAAPRLRLRAQISYRSGR